MMPPLSKEFFGVLLYFLQMLRRLVQFILLTAIGHSALPVVAQTTPAQLSPDCTAYASIPLPQEAESNPAPKSAPDCASYRSYRGLGRPVNYAEAGACAWQERLAQKAGLGQNPNEPAAWVVGGSLILADIYFNAAGVPRNIPLAMRFACEAEEPTAQLALSELAKLSNPPHTQRPFELCDYAATTFSENFCSDYTAEIADDRRNRYYSSLKTSMPPEQKSAFRKLLAAKTDYVRTHAFEVDQEGTIRVVRTIGSETILENLFHAELVQFERKQWPGISQRLIATSDTSLQREYNSTLQRLRDRPKDEAAEETVSADNVSKVEKSWEAYRDAWAAFARLRYPAAADSIRAQITIDRSRLLKTIP